MDKPKIVLRGKQARSKLLEGVNEVYDTVRTTLGPGGRNAMVDRDWRSARVTNDGVFIARNIILDDEASNLAAQTFAQSAQQTNELAGDGTTSTVVVAGTLINNVMKDIEANSSILAGSKCINYRKEIMEARDKALAKLEKKVKKIKSKEQLKDIATVSAEDEKLGELVSDMVWKTGENGYVDVREGYKGKIETEVIEGMRINGKYAAKFLITNPNRMVVEAEDVPVVVTNFKLEKVAEVNEIFQEMVNKNKVATFVLFAHGYSEEVLFEFAKLRNANIRIIALKAPSLTTPEWEDLAVVCDAKSYTRENGDVLKEFKATDAGYVKRIVADDKMVIITGGRGNTVERIKVLKDQQENEKDDALKRKLNIRIGNISASVGVIHVGARSQVEEGYLKLKIEDAVFASQAALEEGYVQGGGLTYSEIASDDILKEALEAPAKQIEQNLGYAPEITEHIIDPAKVVRLAIDNACSVATEIITTDSIIVTKRDRDTYDGFDRLSSQLANEVKYREVRG